MEKNEKIRAPRFKGKLPVEFESGKGFTRDFSASGIYFEADRSFSPGQPVEFTLFMEYIDIAGPVRMKCVGKIVRVEENGEKIGVAAAINSYSFEHIDPTINVSDVL
jgi:hypothetical protein